MMKSNFILLRFLTFLLILLYYVTPCASEKTKKSVDDNREDTGESNDETNDSLAIEENEYTNATSLSCTRRQNTQIHEIKSANSQQFPFMAAIMSHQYEYLCSGTVVSNGLILTTAECLKQTAKYVLLNATKAKRDDTTAVLHIIKSEKFPTYRSGEKDKDVGLIYTSKHNNTIASKIKLSNYTTAQKIVDFQALGFGLNSDVGQLKELQYIGLENRIIESLDYRDIIKGYFDCVETKTPTCFRDTGGPSIFDNELVGIVVTGQNQCIKEISGTYAMNKKLVDILPTYTFKNWLDEKIKKNEETDPAVALMSYPALPLTVDVEVADSGTQVEAYSNIPLEMIFLINFFF